MKKYNIINLAIVIIMLSGTVLYSQTKKINAYYPDDLTISYIKDVVKKNINTDTIFQKIQNIDKVIFLNDSIIIISNEKQKNLKLNTALINSVRLKKGSSAGAGIALGAVGGILLGFLTGYAISPHDTSGTEMINVDAIYSLTGGLFGMAFGMIAGGMIGSSNHHYVTYEFNKPELNKKKELERILKIDKKENKIEN